MNTFSNYCYCLVTQRVNPHREMKICKRKWLVSCHGYNDIISGDVTNFFK